MRSAACQCGQANIVCHSEPVRVTICHCLACQARSGSAFGYQARFDENEIEISGELAEFLRVSDDGTRISQYFCPNCGSGLYYWSEAEPDLIAVPVGIFADPDFPTPSHSFYESRRHSWLTRILPSAKHRRH